MKFSEKWLRTWVNPEISTVELIEQLTMAGLEVDSITPAVVPFRGVVVAKVIECVPHPKAELKLCKILTGDNSTFEVACGAPNIALNQKIAFATVKKLLIPFVQFLTSASKYS